MVLNFRGTDPQLKKGEKEEVADLGLSGLVLISQLSVLCALDPRVGVVSGAT